MPDPRIPLLAADDAKTAAAEVEIFPQIAELNVFRTLLHHPKLAKRVSDLLLVLLFGSALDARLRELVIMRIGWATGSVYEWTQHWRVATELDVAEADLLAVRDWRSHADFSETDRAILAATDETIETGTVSPETWAACEKALPSVEERLELVAAIGTWSMISTILRSLEVPLEDGVAAWPPDGVAPSDA